MVVRGAVADIRIEGAGSVVDLCPAGDKAVVAAAGGAGGLEVLEDGEFRNKTASSAYHNGCGKTGVIAAADTIHADSIDCVGLEIAEIVGSRRENSGVATRIDGCNPSVLAAASRPRDGDGVGGYVGSLQRSRCGAGKGSHHNIVDSCRRLSTATTVVGPHKDEVVRTCGEAGRGHSGLPVALEIHLAAQVNPAGRSGCGVVVSAGAAFGIVTGVEHCRCGSYPSTQIVVVALTVSFPVEADCKLAAVSDDERTVGIAELCGAGGVCVAGAVVV